MQAIKSIDPDALKPIVRQMVLEAMGNSVAELQERHGIQPEQQEQPETAQPQE